MEALFIPQITLRMPQLSRDPLQRTHRPAGCEWLSRYVSDRDGCHRPAGRGVFSPHRSLYSTAVLRGISHPRRASARTPYLQPAASSSGPRTARDWTGLRTTPLSLVPTNALAPPPVYRHSDPPSAHSMLGSQGSGLILGMECCQLAAGVFTHTDRIFTSLSGALLRTSHHDARLRTPRCASPETEMQ